jgi:hypothetical protein
MTEGSWLSSTHKSNSTTLESTEHSYMHNWRVLFSTAVQALRIMHSALLQQDRQWRNYHGLRPGEPGGPQPQWAK